MMAKDWMVNNDSVKVAATLISRVGDMVRMKYGPSASSASTSDLVTCFSQLGISSIYRSADNWLAWQYIYENRIPIVVRAVSQDDEGHCWIMDGAALKETTRTCIYDLVDLEDLGTVPMVPIDDDEIGEEDEEDDDDLFVPMIPLPMYTVYDTRTETTTERLRTFTMNFGWNSSDDDIIFSLNDEWITCGGSIYSGGRKMIYNFTF